MVNLSGDGENNDGIQPRVALREFGFERRRSTASSSGAASSGCGATTSSTSSTGRRSFVEVALAFEDFAEAMRRKLIRELGPVASAP
jgi:Ca-activated chloride channel homolog